MSYKLPVILSLLGMLIISSCSCTMLRKHFPRLPKPKPEYVGVAKEVEPIVNEWLELSRQNRIAFDNKVSVGMKEIDIGNIIGICTYQLNFREIDIDREFFDRASLLRQKALIFHELTHCYCSRAHDYASGQNYADGMVDLFFDRVTQQIPWCLVKTPPGFLDDQCPSSIMYPTILSDDCLEKHWPYYIKEMFDRCDPF